jgi:Bacterial Ig domain
MNKRVHVSLSGALLLLASCNLVDPAPTITLSSDAIENTVAVGGEVKFTATVSADTTEVQFLEGDKLLFKDTQSPFTHTEKFPTAAKRGFTAKAVDAAGNTTLSDPLEITSSDATQGFQMTLEVDVAQPQNGQTVSLSVNSSDDFPQGGSVEFFADGTSIGSDNTAPFTFAGTFPEGEVSLEAVLKDSSGKVVARAKKDITVVGNGGVAFKVFTVKLKSIEALTEDESETLDENLEVIGQVFATVKREDGSDVVGGNGTLFNIANDNEAVEVTGNTTVTNELKLNIQSAANDNIVLSIALREFDPTGGFGGAPRKLPFKQEASSENTVVVQKTLTGSPTFSVELKTFPPFVGEKEERIKLNFEVIVPTN